MTGRFTPSFTVTNCGVRCVLQFEIAASSGSIATISGLHRPLPVVIVLRPNLRRDLFQVRARTTTRMSWSPPRFTASRSIFPALSARRGMDQRTSRRSVFDVWRLHVLRNLRRALSPRISRGLSSVSETRMVSPRPSHSSEPMPMAILMRPSSPSPASVTPR